ncbi:hypothetical protein [Staphylococcus capitis]|uniref:hypothetical protein n=1 Tax=Staphylococcus capitis TaxID=29388 RepID=UPI000D19F4C2|nr:hypothetical protein [Staphylococcus capitis]PTH39446.1 hypothetical protein BU619_08075 [Staphylococcus capitis]
MSKKTLNIISIILLVVVLGGVYLIVHSSHESKERQIEANKEQKDVGPALTGKKDKEAKQQKEKEEQEKKEKEKEKSKNDKDKKESSNKSTKESTKELTDNATFLLQKTIQGTKNNSEEEQVNDIATEKMINQVDGADESNASKEIDIRNTSIEFKNTHNFTDKTINGTYKYDLIMKDKDSDTKNTSTTNLDQTSSVKFIKENGKYKLDQISK